VTSLLEVKNISKSYGGFRALTDVSFTVEEGESLAIIGPNGAGKTTLFKALTGEISGDTGEIYFTGIDISTWPVDDRVRSGIGRTFQIVRIFPKLTTLENVIVAIESRLRSGDRLISSLRVNPSAAIRSEAHARLAAVGLKASASAEASHLSLGDKKRLELALTLALEPRLLMFDEPTAGMSPSERIAIIDVISSVKEQLGLTIIFTEHDIDFVFRLTGRVMVLNQGEVVTVGLPDAVRSNPIVRQIYLGRTGHA